VHNHESQRRQHGLADRARQLGWTCIEVIDDDLGRSAGGISRPGFERLLAAICDGRVGAVLAIEASRLARNGRDWHTLIEFYENGSRELFDLKKYLGENRYLSADKPVLAKQLGEKLAAWRKEVGARRMKPICGTSIGTNTARSWAPSRASWRGPLPGLLRRRAKYGRDSPRLRWPAWR